METLTNFKDWSRSRIKISVLASLCRKFSSLIVCPLDAESAKIYLSYDISGFLYDILGPQAVSWKRFHGQNK